MLYLLQVATHLLTSIKFVEPDSAKIGGVEEGLDSIPANHRNMTKFGSAEDVGFTRVSAQLKVWVEEIGAHHSKRWAFTKPDIDFLSSRIFTDCIQWNKNDAVSLRLVI